MRKRSFGAAPGGFSAGSALQPPCGSVRSCLPYRGEVARHRVITADGHHVAVATAESASPKGTFVTGVYPVQQGYLVMVRQPLCEVRSATIEAARTQHEQIVHVLAEAGLAVVRARRALAARRRSEGAEVKLHGVATLPPEWLRQDAGQHMPASV